LADLRAVVFLHNFEFFFFFLRETEREREFSPSLQDVSPPLKGPVDTKPRGREQGRPSGKKERQEKRERERLGAEREERERG